MDLKRIENAVKEKFSLLTPENGDHQSSFVIVDIDNDGLEEAFVFYVLTDTPEIAKVSFFRYFENSIQNISWFGEVRKCITAY